MTITEALCVVQRGWRGPDEHLVYGEALDIIHDVARRVQLERQHAVIANEIAELAAKHPDTGP